MERADTLLAAEKLSVRHGQNLVLDRVSLEVHEREIVTVIGPNGAGKTTLLRCLLGLQAPSIGNVRRRAGLRVGYMPQGIVVSETLPLTVGRFLQLAGGRSGDLRSVLERTGVVALVERPLAAISGGELQRVLLARALLAGPQLLVLDEPAQGVDVQGQTELYRLIASLQQEYDCAVLMVSHDLHLVMAATDSVICLNRHVCCHGHPESVSSDPAFLELFGRPQETGLALYSHHHDHQHDLHGDVNSADGPTDA